LPETFALLSNSEKETKHISRCNLLALHRIVDAGVAVAGPNPESAGTDKRATGY